MPSDAKTSLHRVELSARASGVVTRDYNRLRPFLGRAAKPRASEFEFPIRADRFFGDRYNSSNAEVMTGSRSEEGTVSSGHVNRTNRAEGRDLSSPFGHFANAGSLDGSARCTLRTARQAMRRDTGIAGCRTASLRTWTGTCDVLVDPAGKKAISPALGRCSSPRSSVIVTSPDMIWTISSSEYSHPGYLLAVWRERVAYLLRPS
jgi:hypothetical protein